MEIRWLGHSFFEVKTDTISQKGVRVCFDPYSDEIGLAFPKDMESEIVLISHDHFDHNNAGGFKDPGIIINTPGEYSVKGVDIQGILTYHDKNEGKDRGTNIVFSVTSENIRIVHLGDLGHMLDEKQLKNLGKVDVLFLPVGGKNALDVKEGMKLLKEIGPKIVVPMHYKIPGINLEIDSLDPFCKEMGICPGEPLRKLITKPSSLEGKEMEVVVLEKN